MGQPPARRPAPRAPARYMLVGDQQSKRGFDQREAAGAEAMRLLGRFPHLKVQGEENQDIAARP